MKDLLERLITFKTVSNDHKAQATTLSWIKNQLTGLPLITTEYERNGSSSLLLTTHTTKKPALWLAAHIDVVPGPDTVFIPRCEGSKLFGRGAIDMKFAVCCYMRLLQELREQLPRLDLGVMLTSDEETGGQNGVGALVKEGYGADIVFLPDGGSVWDMEVKAKGMFHFELRSEGRQAHAAKPWEGDNPFHRLFAALQELSTLFPSEPCGDERHCHSTMNIGKLNGGEVGNQVPSCANALIDIRCFSEDEIALRDALRALIARYSGLELREIVSGFPYESDCSHDAFQLFKNIARDLYGITVGKTISHGSSDARYFAKAGIPVLLVNPAGGSYHCDNEWVDLDDLERYYAVLKKWVTDISRID